MVCGVVYAVHMLAALVSMLAAVALLSLIVWAGGYPLQRSLRTAAL